MDLAPKISATDFEMIQEYWGKYLWANRKSEIAPTSCLTRELSIDLSLKKASATFLKAEAAGELLGVISGFKTEPQWYRIRGLYVTPATRLEGVGAALVNAIIEEAKRQDCTAVWTLPRQSAWEFYSRQGFIQKTDWFEENMEFGPNCYAELKI